MMNIQTFMRNIDKYVLGFTSLILQVINLKSVIVYQKHM